MVLGGLWHGAGWNFVIWGGLHGVFLALYRAFGSRANHDDEAIRWSDLPLMAAGFHLTCFAWVFFRAQNFEEAGYFLGGLFRFSDYTEWPLIQLAIVLVCGSLHFLERVTRTHLPRIREILLRPWGAWVEGAAIGLIAAVSLVLGGAGGEFIYFQF